MPNTSLKQKDGLKGKRQKHRKRMIISRTLNFTQGCRRKVIEIAHEYQFKIVVLTETKELNG